MKIKKSELLSIIKEEIMNIKEGGVVPGGYDQGDKNSTVSNLLRSVTLEVYDIGTTYMEMYSPEDIANHVLNDERISKLLKAAIERECNEYLEEIFSLVRGRR